MSPPEPDARAVCLDVADLSADATVVDELARLALDLRRGGVQLVLCNAPSELIDLIELCGLAEALPSSRAQASLD